MQWKEAQSRFAWWAFTSLAAILCTILGWLTLQVLMRPTMVDIEKAVNHVERALSATILTRNDVAAMVRSDSPYIEDRKLIVQQFQNIDRSLDALQVEMKALRADVVEMRLIINRRYRNTGP